MIKNEIELKALNSFGIAKAYVSENSITIKVYGVSGCLKAWLTGSETMELGNLVNGSLTRQVSLNSYDGILITQSGRQMFFAKLSPSNSNHQTNNIKNDLPDDFPFSNGYTWQKITSRKFPSENLSVRYILSHKCFYNAFLLHGEYYYGTNSDKSAIAIRCNIKNEPHPFLHLAPYAILRNNYIIVCTDGKNFHAYEY